MFIYDCFIIRYDTHFLMSHAFTRSPVCKFAPISAIRPSVFTLDRSVRLRANASAEWITVNSVKTVKS